MASTTIQDDELIILSDSVTPMTDETPIITEDLSNDSAIISFDASDLSENPIDNLKTATKTPDNNWLDLDSWVNFLFWDSSIKGTPEVQQDTNTMDNLFSNIDFSEAQVAQEKSNLEPLSADSQILQDPFDLTASEEENSVVIPSPKDNSSVGVEMVPELFEESALVKENVEVKTNDIIIPQVDDLVETWDMNSILDTTIAKLISRQEWINDIKAQKSWTIIDLEAKIKELREKVMALKKEVDWLDTENEKIDINIAGLESMKMWKTVKDAPKTREHNTKRVAKVA